MMPAGWCIARVIHDRFQGRAIEPVNTLGGTLVRQPQEAAPRRSSAAAGWSASGPERSGSCATIAS